jgi:SAM-dependent methyltransferase
LVNSNIFGELYANTYDVIYASKNYVQECDLLEGLFENKKSVNSILDLGCGTGRHAAELSKRGYHIVGLDQSPQMIKIAQDKKIPACEFKLSDIRSFDLNQKFDAVLLMFNVIGYVPDESELLDLFANARRHLSDGGLLIFDFWYAPAIRQSPPMESTKKDVQEGLNIYRKASGKLDLANNSVLVECTVMQGDDSQQETHTVRYFELNELRNLLSQSGYEDISFGDVSDFKKQPNADNWSAVAWSKSMQRT